MALSFWCYWSTSSNNTPPSHVVHLVGGNHVIRGQQFATSRITFEALSCEIRDLPKATIGIHLSVKHGWKDIVKPLELEEKQREEEEEEVDQEADGNEEEATNRMRLEFKQQQTIG